MATFFLILATLAIIHFIIEGIVPSTRMNLRFKLFEIRDRLRKVRHEYGVVLDTEVYHYLENSINNSIQHLHLINLNVVIDATRSIASNPQLRAEVQKRIDMLTRCQLKEIKDIQKEYTIAFAKTIATNCAGWFIYIIPILFVISFLGM